MIITKERGLQSQLVEGQSLLGYLSQLGENKERRSEGEKMFPCMTVYVAVPQVIVPSVVAA